MATDDDTSSDAIEILSDDTSSCSERAFSQNEKSELESVPDGALNVENEKCCLVDDEDTDIDPLKVLEKLRLRIQDLQLRSAKLASQSIPLAIPLPHYQASLRGKRKEDLFAKAVKERLDLQLNRSKESDSEAAVRLRRAKNMPPLDERAYSLVSNAWKRQGSDEVLISKFRMRITVHDLRKLQPHEWLNDEVINFYGEMIMNRCQQKLGEFPSVHVFNTFFYSTLRDRGYAGVKSWGRNARVFEKDLLLIPVHLGAHWCCGVVDLVQKQLIYLDSLLGSNPAFFNLLQLYLQEEHQERLQEKLDFSVWKIMEPKEIPKQENCYDCGVFASIFAEFASRRARFEFSQSDMPYFRKKMALEVLQGHLI